MGKSRKPSINHNKNVFIYKDHDVFLFSFFFLLEIKHKSVKRSEKSANHSKDYMLKNNHKLSLLCDLKGYMKRGRKKRLCEFFFFFYPSP